MNRSDYEYDFSINSCPKIVFVTRRMKQFVAELIIFKYKPKVANIMTNLKICLEKKIKCVFNKILGLIVRTDWEVSAGGHLTSALVPILSYVCSLKWYAMIGRASSAVRCHVQPILLLAVLATWFRYLMVFIRQWHQENGSLMQILGNA